jgi:hypothetical protein
MGPSRADRDPGGEEPTGLSRRAYLKLAGATAGYAAAGGFALSEADRRLRPLPEAHERTSYYAGPAAERPETAPEGTRYFAFDTGAEYVSTRSGWVASDVAAPRVRADAVDGLADHVVRTTAELERAFDRLEAGDTVRVEPGVYRPSDWLDVDVDGVRVLGASAAETLLKPADGANCGGVRVGLGRAVEDVVVAGLGFDGNDRAMDDAVKRCHAFLVHAGRGVTVSDCYATRTHPYHEHDAGGSGVTVRRGASDVAVVNNRTHDVGDRGIQVSGRNVVVRGNTLTDGYDRCISLEVREPDGRKYYSRNVTVVNNLGRDNSEGSVVGASQGWTRGEGPGNYAIVGNVAAGTHRRTVYMGIEEGVRNVAIVGNVGRQDAISEERAGIYVSGNVSSFVVAGNSLAGYSGHGIELAGSGAGFTCTGNSVLDAGLDGIHVATPEGTVANNVVEGAAGAGIEVPARDVVVSGNTVRNAGGHGVHLAGRGAVATGNAVAGYARDGRGDGIRVGARETVVASNRVTGTGTGDTPAVREVEGADGNLFVGNALPEDDPVRVRGPATRTAANRPATGGPYAVRPDEGVASVSFDRPYDRKPALDVQTDAAALWEADWRTDAAGRYVGVSLVLVAPDGSPVAEPARVHVDVPR